MKIKSHQKQFIMERRRPTSISTEVSSAELSAFSTFQQNYYLFLLLYLYPPSTPPLPPPPFWCGGFVSLYSSHIFFHVQFSKTRTAEKGEIDFRAYPTIKRTREITHNMHWYILNLGLFEAVGAYLWLTHPNCGRIRNTNPRRKPEKNPPIWAKLSTCGRIPTAKFTTTMITRVNNAANWTFAQNY